MEKAIPERIRQSLHHCSLSVQSDLPEAGGRQFQTGEVREQTYPQGGVLRNGDERDI